MKKNVPEGPRDIDFSNAKRGAVIPLEPGKVKVSIRLDRAVVDYFRHQVEVNCSGNYQTLINHALQAHIQQQSMLEAVRQVVREELGAPAKAKPVPASSRTAKASAKSGG